MHRTVSWCKMFLNDYTFYLSSRQTDQGQYLTWGISPLLTWTSWSRMRKTPGPDEWMELNSLRDRSGDREWKYKHTAPKNNDSQVSVLTSCSLYIFYNNSAYIKITLLFFFLFYVHLRISWFCLTYISKLNGFDCWFYKKYLKTTKLIQSNRRTTQNNFVSALYAERNRGQNTQMKN